MILEICWNSENINKNFAAIDDRRTSKRHVLCGIVVIAVVVRSLRLCRDGAHWIILSDGVYWLLSSSHRMQRSLSPSLLLSLPVSFCSKMAY